MAHDLYHWLIGVNRRLFAEVQHQNCCNYMSGLISSLKWLNVTNFRDVTTLSDCGVGTFVYTLPRRRAGSFIGQISFLSQQRMADSSPEDNSPGSQSSRGTTLKAASPLGGQLNRQPVL